MNEHVVISNAQLFRFGDCLWFGFVAVVGWADLPTPPPGSVQQTLPQPLGEAVAAGWASEGCVQGVRFWPDRAETHRGAEVPGAGESQSNKGFPKNIQSQGKKEQYCLVVLYMDFP